MNIQELLNHHAQRPAKSVPNWMLGYFKRYAISFANGMTDLQTHVCWIQSRNFTIDLRLPIASQQVTVKKLAEYSAEELNTLANYEGWEALCDWQGETLSWRETDCSLQLHNRWTEPGILKRYGNCMIELAPSGAYVEDWRLQPSAPGPLIGLRLVEERNLATGIVRHRGGGLIICGEYAALVLGRAEPIASTQPYNALRKLAVDAQGQPDKLAALFNFETSVAKGSITDGYRVSLSTRPERVGESLCALDGFEFLPDQNVVRQTLVRQGILCERLFSIDTIETEVFFEQTTGFTPAAQEWYERESQTLTRYTNALF